MALEQEFTSLVNASKGIIYKVIRLYVNNREDEKDLYQEILFQAWKSYARFDGRSAFSTWLYRVSLNTVLTWKRRPHKVEANEHLEQLPVAAEKGMQDETEALYVAIRSLGEIDRMIIMLHLDGYDHEEIGSIAGLTRNHVAVKLHRIRESLTEKLKKL